MDTNTPVFIRREHIDPPYEPGTQLPVYDLDFENANFRYREEEYNQYISKLNTAYADLNNKYQELTRVNTALGDENELLKRNATNDVRSIYALYAEANAKAIELEADNRTLTRELHLRDEDILIKTGEINRMHNVINELRDQLGRLDVNATVDFQELQRVISDQKNLQKEIGDLRRKLNLSLDYKRKLEQENETLKFDIENLKSKYENELSEKDLRLNQAIRSVDNEVHSRTKDLTVQLTTYTKLEHDNIVLDKKNKELIHEIALHINAEKLLHQEIEHRERQIEALRRELEVFRDPKRKATLLSFRPSANTHLIKLCNNRFDREKAGYLFTIWRLRYALENESKFKLHNGPNQSVMRGENLKGSASKKIVFDFDNNSDISVATSLTDGVLRVLRYLREKASAMIFEVFVRSSDNAEQKKANSLILFSVNIKEIDDRAWKGLTLLLDVYTVIRRLMKTFHPKFVKLRKPAGAGVLEKQLSLSVGKLSSQKGEFRDRTQINRFIENSLVYIVNKRKYDEDPNREFLFLFRVLAIKYRVLYPMRGKELDIEEDLRAYLDHKILSSLQKVLKAHPKENQPLFDTKLVEDLEAQNLLAYDNA